MYRLLFGDNLNWLRDAKVFPEASVDLVYLAPPTRPTPATPTPPVKEAVFHPRTMNHYE
jgi:hypothetical protein